MQEAVIRLDHQNKTSVLDNILSPIEYENNEAETTILAFGGMRRSIGMPKAEFFNSLSGTEKYNILFIKDFHQVWYQSGLLGLTDNIEDTVEYLESVIPPSTKKLVTVGASSGGFAAILFGALLHASRTISFAPQTFIDKEVFDTFKTPISKWEYLEKAEYTDLKKVIAEHTDTVHDVYIGNDEQDIKMLEHIQSSENVREYRVDTESHNVAKVLKQRGRLDEILLSI